MTHLIRMPLALTALLAISLLGTSARADLIVQVGEDGGPLTTVIDITGAAGQPVNDPASSLNTTTTDFRLNGLGGEANQFVTVVGLATTTTSEVSSSATSVTNMSAATHTLNIVITGTGFTAPTALPSISLSSSIGGSTSATRPTDTLTFQSYVAGLTYTPAQTPGIGASLSSYNDSKSGAITSLTAPFSVSETVNIKLGAGDGLNFSAHTSLQQTLVSSAVPEPSSLAIAGLGALGMIGYGLRRRKALGA